MTHVRRSFVLPGFAPYDLAPAICCIAEIAAAPTSLESARSMCQMGLWTAQWNINAPSELSIFGGGMVSSFQTGRPEMSLPDDDEKHRDGKMQADNVVRLGNDTLFAIADELRRMYDADLRSKPSEQLEQLMRQIERGEDVKPAPVSLKITRKPK